MEQYPLDLEGEGGLVVGEGGKRDADARRDHGLMGAALGREAHPRGSGHDDEPSPRVERVVEGVEPARDERIVERADGKQRHAGQLVREPEGAEGEKEIVLGDAELDVLPRGRFLPLHRLGRLGEEVGSRRGRPHAFAIDPARQMRGHRHVGRQGDDMIAHGHSPELAEDASEGFLGGRLGRIALVELVRDLGLGTMEGRRLERRGPAADQSRLRARRGKDVPLVSRRHAERLAKGFQLRRAEQRTVIHGITRERQPPALDGLGEDHARLGALAPRLLEGFEDGGEVVAAHVSHRRLQRRVGQIAKEAIERRIHLPVRGRDQRLADCPRGPAKERLVLGIGHALEAGAEARAVGPREERLEPPPPAKLDDPPARSLKPVGDLAAPRVGRHAVEALAIHVHDPEEIAETGHVLLEQRLPHIALVELGVAHHGHEALGRPRAPAAADIAPGHRREARRHRPQPHGARREIDDGRVLSPARIGLETAEDAQAPQVVGAQTAPEVFDGIEHRRGMRLGRHHVALAEGAEVERGHQAHHGSGRGLVPAHLGAVGIGARIGVMHGEGGQPEHPALDALEDGEIVGGGGRGHRLNTLAHSALCQVW